MNNHTYPQATINDNVSVEPTEVNTKINPAEKNTITIKTKTDKTDNKNGNKLSSTGSACIKPLTQHSGIALPMLVNNVDTDQIIPSREMKKVSKLGLSDGLFAGQRYLPSQKSRSDDTRLVNPEFILNITPFNRASVLLSGKNFGCGSSREHAVWAIKEFGFKAIIAESFGSIFRTNCLRNGLLPVVLEAKQIRQLHDQIMQDPLNNKVSVDVASLTVGSPNGETFSFELEGHFQEMLIGGLDFISLTQKRKNQIDSFIEQDKINREWAYLK